MYSRCMQLIVCNNNNMLLEVTLQPEIVKIESDSEELQQVYVFIIKGKQNSLNKFYVITVCVK